MPFGFFWVVLSGSWSRASLVLFQQLAFHSDFSFMVNKMSKFLCEVWVFQIEVAVEEEMMQILDVGVKTHWLFKILRYDSMTITFALSCFSLVFFWFWTFNFRFSCGRKPFWTAITNQDVKMNMTDACRKKIPDRRHCFCLFVFIMKQWHWISKWTVLKYLTLTTKNNFETFFC